MSFNRLMPCGDRVGCLFILYAPKVRLWFSHCHAVLGRMVGGECTVTAIPLRLTASTVTPAFFTITQ